MGIVTLTVAAISLIPIIAFAADAFTTPQSGGEAGCQSRVRRHGSRRKGDHRQGQKKDAARSLSGDGMEGKCLI